MGNKNHKNYSDDLKERIVNARKFDKQSLGAIAKRFDIPKVRFLPLNQRCYSISITEPTIFKGLCPIHPQKV